MFEIGLSEMVVIAVVALVVLGPERLPKVARTAGLLLGRAQRYVATVKADLNRELQASELQQVRMDLEAEMRAAEQGGQQIGAELQQSWGEARSILDNDLGPATSLDKADPTPAAQADLFQTTSTSARPEPAPQLDMFGSPDFLTMDRTQPPAQVAQPQAPSGSTPS